MKKTMKTIASGLTFVAGMMSLSTGAAAQQTTYANPLNAEGFDRPTFAASPLTVGKGEWVYEGGISVSILDTDFGEGTDVGFPEALVRYGLNDAAELRLRWTGARFLDLPGALGGQSTGAGMVSPELKINLFNGEDGLPRLALLMGAKLSVSETDNAPESNTLFAGVAWDYPVNDRFRLLGSVEWDQEIDGDEDGFLLNSVGFGLNAYKDIELFTEWVAAFRDEGDTHAVRVGAAWNIANFARLDFSTQADISDNPTNAVTLRGGLAVRF